MLRHPLRLTAFVVVVVLVVAGVYVFLSQTKEDSNTVEEELVPVAAEEIEWPQHQILGTSVEERKIEAYTYGDGEKRLLFVGGIHGGYEWNSVLLSYEFKDYLDLNTEIIPDNVSVTIIPVLNPDGLYKVSGKEGRFEMTDLEEDRVAGLGRFNGNDVDLNRNFDCKWQPESTWRGKVVGAGFEAFSEPEAIALRDFVLEVEPVAVVFWHSQANAVYASECEEGVLPETVTLMNTYSNASGYKAIESFDAYPVTGDAEGWLASIGIPAVTVELSTKEVTEWDGNLAGVTALLELYSR